MENIELINDGSGLGFGIVGGKNSGVIVRSIVPGGVADRDGRLKSGDLILQVSCNTFSIFYLPRFVILYSILINMYR